MSALVENASLNFDEFIIELCSYDIRDFSGVKEIKNIFKNNTKLLASDNCMRVIYNFHKVRIDLSNLFNSLERFFENKNIDNALISEFLKSLMYISSKVEVNNDVMVEELPDCCCCDDDRYHKVTCDEISKERNAYIVDLIKNSCCSFKEEISAGFDAFSNHPNVELGYAFMNCKTQIKQLNRSASEFYECITNCFCDRTYKTFTFEQQVSFHNCIVEILTRKLISSIKDVNEMEVYVKKNADKLGIRYYTRLMHKLKLIGWYGINGFYDELRCIATTEEVWTNDVKELPIFKGYVAEILFRSIDDRSEREEVLYNLKLISKYVLLSFYARLISIFYDDRVYDSKEMCLKFYKTLNEVALYTEKNGFINYDNKYKNDG